MPVINNFNLGLRSEEILQLNSFGTNHRIRLRMQSLIPEILDEIDHLALIRPMASYALLAVEDIVPGRLSLAGGAVLNAPVVSHRLAGASILVAGVVTIGAAVNTAISSSFANGSTLKAVLMEEIANRLLFKASDEFLRVIDEEAARLNQQASGRLAPGDDGIDFNNQTVVLSLAGAEAIGIRLSATGVMDPVHSTSLLIGIGKRMQRWSQFENCQDCPSRPRCRHRCEANSYAECV